MENLSYPRLGYPRLYTASKMAFTTKMKTSVASRTASRQAVVVVAKPASVQTVRRSATALASVAPRQVCFSVKQQCSPEDEPRVR